jgi:hypothetical protein
MGGLSRRERTLTGPHLVDFQIRVARSEFGHDEGEEIRPPVGGEGKRIHNSRFVGAPVGYSSPPIRDGIPLLPTPTSHKPLLSNGNTHCS